MLCISSSATAMQSGYTCQRCCHNLKRIACIRPSASVYNQLPRRRPKSTNTRPILHNATTVTSQQRCTIASLEPQVQDVSIDRPEIHSSSRHTGKSSSSLSGNVLLEPNNLFHPFSESPSPDIRRRAAFMKTHAYCPHPSHHRTRMPLSPHDPETRKTPGKSDQPPAFVRFECPDCGIPVSCSEEHWADDYESHIEICDTLREINEDDHDLRSGRFFPEFEYPGPQMEEMLVNMTNWDTYLYSRQYDAINDDRSLRQVTKLLTYPLTIGSILSELSPYTISHRKGGRFTAEGLRSLAALRYSLHPPRTGGDDTMKGIRPEPPPMRLFILGARAESSLPREVWHQLAYLFPRVTFHIIFIGPESMANRDSEFPLPERTPRNPFGAVVEDRISPTHQMKVSTIVEYYHTIHEAGLFQPFDPYFDCFVLFHPGLGHPASSHEWQDTIPQLLETKVPIISTGYTEWDMRRDLEWVKEKVGGEMDILMEPGENKFRSLRWDLNDFDPADISCGNWGVWAFRGKRYETMMKD